MIDTFAPNETQFIISSTAMKWMQLDFRFSLPRLKLFWMRRSSNRKTSRVNTDTKTNCEARKVIDGLAFTSISDFLIHTAIAKFNYEATINNILNLSNVDVYLNLFDFVKRFNSHLLH